MSARLLSRRRIRRWRNIRDTTCGTRRRPSRVSDRPACWTASLSGSCSHVSEKSLGSEPPISRRVSSCVLPMIIGMCFEMAGRVRIERVLLERPLIQHRPEIEPALADHRVRRGHGLDDFFRGQRGDFSRPGASERRGTRGARSVALSGPEAVTCWPLMVTARWKRLRAAGMPIRVAIFAPPPDWPNTMHTVRVAAELLDVVTHPLQRHHQVQHARVAGVGELRASQPGEIQIPEAVQAMVDA